MNCIFCNIDKSKIIYETNNIYVIEDIKPKAKLHLLFISKIHFDNILDAYKSNKSEIIFKEIMNYLDKNTINRFQLHINCSKEMGQVINHLHIHILSNFF